jgi:ATP/maltotriose-dependent transcriptional regulator MalT
MTGLFGPARELPAALGDAVAMPKATQSIMNVPTRAAQLLRECLESRVCVVAASAGWGKTTAARAALDGREHLWIDLGAAPDEPGKLLWELGRAFGWAPDGGYGSIRAFAARIPERVGVLALDDAHALADDPLSLELLRAIVEHRKDLRLMLVGREDLPLPIATWIASGIAALPVTEADLAVGAGELRALLRAGGLRDDEATVAAVLRFTHGWAVAVHFALMAMRRSPDLARVETIGRDLAFKYLAEQILADLDDERRRLLGDLSLAGPFDAELVAALGYANPRELADWVLRAGLPLHRPPGGVRLHDVFTTFLLAQMNDGERAERGERVAEVLTARGRTGEAFDVLRANAPERLCAYLEERGLELLQSGRRNSVRKAIAGLPIRSRRENAAILMLRASLEHGAGNFSRAKALSDRALEKADRDSPSFVELVRLRAILKLYEPLEDASRWIEEAMRTASEDVRRELRGPHAIYLAMNGAISAAVAEMLAVIADAEAADRTPLLARAYTWAMTVFAHAGDYDRVAAFGAKAAAIHERTQDLKGLVIVHNTLSLAGYLLKDDREETLAEARAYADAAEAWGDPVSVKQSTAFLYQLAVERGDAASAAALERKLGESDLSFGGVLWYRHAMAVRRGWEGDFAKGAALLEGLSEHVTDSEERRCWHAIAAFFSALAGDASAAQRHLDSAASEPERPTESAVSQRLRRLARLYAGFAELYLGRAAAARRRFTGAVRRNEAALAAAGLELSRPGSRGGMPSIEAVARDLERAGQAGFAALLRAATRAAAAQEPPSGLSAAEIRVLRDLAAGISPKQIALESGRSVETIRNQVKAAIRKLGVSGRLEAIAAARGAGLI